MDMRSSALQEVFFVTLSVHDPETHAMLALEFTPGLGPVRIKTLLEHFGDAQTVLETKLIKLRDVPGLDSKSIAGIGSSQSLERASTELERAAKLEVQVIVSSSANYPAALKAIYDPPPVLWVRGDVVALEELVGVTPRSVGIVGTRKCSPHARAFTAKLARELAEVGVTVISGLARGIDTEAHRSSVEAGGKSIGVLGSGVDHIYPSENTALAAQLTLVSAYPIGTRPAAHNFPARNRIIAGLASGTVVIEGDLDSGSLITAVAALEAGRTVFAMPGRPGESNAKGPNRLIKEGAVLIESATDILDEMHWGSGLHASVPAPSLEGDEARVYAALDDALLVDDIVLRTGLAMPTAQSILMMLKLKNLILELPGGRYSRI
jgi:DNA processing protein